MTAAHGDRTSARSGARAPLSLIVNPFAGGGRAGRRLGEVQAALARLGLPHQVHRTSSLDHARELARDAAAAGETAVAFGGDGLIGAVADALRDGAGMLGILPGGRGNDLARALGIPPDPARACEVLRDGAIVRLDLGAVGDRTFVGIASCGFDSVANRIANDARLVRGNLVYAYGALRALAGWQPATFTVVVDGATRTLMGYTVAVANSCCYGGGMRIAPDASLRDGLLDVVIVRHTPRLRFLTLLPSVFSGSHVGYDGVEVLRGREIEIAASRPFDVYADGDPIAPLPATIKVLPSAVSALVPAS